MKKKLLSLVLAGAMVASTSVSAFAADTEVVRDNNGTANVTIKGAVDSNEGNAPAGTISVSVPTALSFSVNNKGEVSGGKIVVENNGVGTVDITAVKFYDKTPTSKIIVDTPNSFNEGNSTRDKMFLSIGGNQSERAYFKSESLSSDKIGIYNISGAKKEDGIKISSIEGGGRDTLNLEGLAGKQELNGGFESTGMTDEFTLTLKISKVN